MGKSSVTGGASGAGESSRTGELSRTGGVSRTGEASEIGESTITEGASKSRGAWECEAGKSEAGKVGTGGSSPKGHQSVYSDGTGKGEGENVGLG